MEVNELLDAARDNITKQQEAVELEVAMQSLQESAIELNSIHELEKTWIDLRNKIISKLYHEHNVSMIRLGEICGISRQMVHYICKGRKA